MTVRELTESGKYGLLLAIKHKEIIPFVLEQLGKNSFLPLFFKALNVLLFLTWLIASFLFTKAGAISFLPSLLYWLLGAVIGTTVIIPLHELLHGIAYKFLGAPKISYRGSFKQMMFYAAADQFVVSMPAFRFIALTPFVIISAMGAAGYFLGDAEIKFLSLGLLLSHTIACAGDFGLLSYIGTQKGKLLYTYDDMTSEVSFVYEKITASKTVSSEDS